MMASTLNKRIYEDMIKTVVKLYLFIENKELSFNIGL